MRSNEVALIQNLNWSYRKTALFTNLSTHFEENTFTTIIGPNGSGKTTLLRHLLRHLRVEKGTILLPHGDLLDYSQKQLARYISYVPQQSRIEYDFTVYECVAMGRYAHSERFSTLTHEDHSIIKHSLEAMNLSSLSHRSAVELSGGEYQRVLIARSLAQQAKVMLLDEPVSHLDLYNQQEILKILRNLVDQKKATVISVLHDLNAVSAYSDHIIMLEKGSIVAEGKVSEVLTKSLIQQVYQIEVEITDSEKNGRPTISLQWT